MASLYKNNKTWYVSVYIDGKRGTRSLKTEDYKVAKKLKPYAEYQIIAELMGFIKPNKDLTFTQLAKKFLTQVKRAKNTQLIYENVLKCISLASHFPPTLIPEAYISEPLMHAGTGD